MKAIVSESKTLMEALESMGSNVEGKYYYLPYWFEKTEGGLMIHTFEKLPEELKQEIERLRQ